MRVKAAEKKACKRRQINAADVAVHARSPGIRFVTPYTEQKFSWVDILTDWSLDRSPVRRPSP